MYPPLLGIAGASSAGKDTAIDHILKPLGYIGVRTSDMLRSQIQQDLGKTLDLSSIAPSELARRGSEIRQREGEDFFTKCAIEAPIDGHLKVVNGLRREAEFNALHDAGGLIILIISDTQLSVRRMLDRQRTGDAGLSPDIIQHHIEREKSDLDHLRYKADLVLWNVFRTQDKFLRYAERQVQAFLESERTI